MYSGRFRTRKNINAVSGKSHTIYGWEDVTVLIYNPKNITGSP